MLPGWSGNNNPDQPGRYSSSVRTDVRCQYKGCDEMAVYTSIEKALADIHPLINKARKALGLPEIGKIENYFPFLRDPGELADHGMFGFADDGGRAVQNLKKPVDPYFFKSRAGSKKPLLPNLFDTLEGYMSKASQYINDAPVVAEAKRLLGDIEYLDAHGNKKKFSYADHDPERADALQRWLNFSAVDKKAHSLAVGTIGPDAVRAMQTFQKNAAAATLSINVRPMLLQWASLRNSYMELGAKWMLKGASANLNSAFRKMLFNKSDTLQGRTFDVTTAAMLEKRVARGTADTVAKKAAYAVGAGLEKAGKPVKAVAKAGILGLQFGDSEVYRITLGGAFLQGVAPKSEGGLGLTPEKAMERADTIATQTQGSAARRDISPLQRSVEGKLVSMFQTFAINEFAYMNSKLFGKKEDGLTGQERTRNIMRFALATVIVNCLFEDVLQMRSPFPTPERTLVDVVRGKKTWQEGAVEASKEMVEPVPLVGSMWRWGSERKTMLPFALQSLTDTFEGGQKAMRAFTNGDYSRLEWADLTPLAQLLGLPGWSQAMKTSRRRQQGGSWYEAVLGQQLEKLGSNKTKASQELLKKYSPQAPAGKPGQSSSRKRLARPTAKKDLLKKYGY